MPNANTIQWKRLSIEATAIIASILLAFAIDAWWAERLERIDERRSLVRLYDEFESNRERIDGWISAGRSAYRGMESALHVSELLDAALKNGLDSVSIPDTQIAALIQTSTFEAELPVYEGLVRSGRIEIIENDDIINAIAVWERSLRNTSEQQLTGRRFVNDQLLPALASNPNLRHVLLNQFVPVQVVPLDPDGMTEIRVDPLVVNLVAQRYFWAALARRSMTSTRDSADQVMFEISKFLEN